MAINAVLMGLVAMALLWLMRRLPRYWWVGGSVVVIVAATLWVLVSPVVLDPLFNRFTPLRQEPLRGEVLRLARDAGVQVSEIQVMDASKRTTGANAYVAGLGASKRIVIYDNLLNDFDHAEQLNIIAHELGHEHYKDVRNGLIYIAIVAPFGMFALALATRRFAPGDLGTPADAARARALARARSPPASLHLQLALAPGRGPRGLLRAARDERPRRADRAAEAARDPQRLRPRAAGLADRGLRHAPAADGPDRDGAGLPRPRRRARLDLVGVVAVALIEVGEPHPDVAVL